MAKFSIPNLCGANANFNAVATKMDDIKTKLQANVTAKASSLSLTMKTELVTLDLNLSLLMTKKPTIPNISLQVEIKDLATLTVGSAGYNAKVASITAKFGPALAKKNLDVIKLAAAAVLLIAGKKDICDLVPNLEIAVTGGDVIEKAKNVTQPDEDSDKEEISIIVNPVIALNAANAKIALRLTEAAKQFESIIPKLTFTAGSTGRVGSDVRQAFREADVQISAAMSKAGFSSSPTDQRIEDIDASGLLVGADGTAEPWINPDAQEEEFDRKLATPKLDAVVTDFRDLLQKASKPYPENLDDTGTKVFFPPAPAEMEKLKDTATKTVKFKEVYRESLTSSAKQTSYSMTSVGPKLRGKDLEAHQKTMEKIAAHMRATMIRPVFASDKKVEPDLATKEPKNVPKYDDYQFDD